MNSLEMKLSEVYHTSSSGDLFSEHLGQGNKTGVLFLQAIQSASLPQRSSAFSYNKFTPDTLQISTITNKGLISEMNCHSFKLDPANRAAPIQTTISPAQLGCLEIDHKPTFINLPLFDGFELQEYFWQSAVVQVIRPIAQTTNPMIYNQTRDPEKPVAGSFVIITSRVLIVMRTQKPCINQTRKNFSLDSLIYLNLLSQPLFMILMKRKRESLSAHTPTIHAAMICWQVGSWLDRVAIKVMEMQVIPPVRSKNNSV